MTPPYFSTFEAFRAHCLNWGCEIYIRHGASNVALSDLPPVERDAWIQEWWTCTHPEAAQ